MTWRLSCNLRSRDPDGFHETRMSCAILRTRVARQRPNRMESRITSRRAPYAGMIRIRFQRDCLNPGAEHIGIPLAAATIYVRNELPARISFELGSIRALGNRRSNHAQSARQDSARALVILDFPSRLPTDGRPLPVARDGIEPPTRGFSVRCSTN